MKPVRREDILDYETYDERRADFRREVLAAKEARRVHVGAHLTFLFENTLTVRYQIQEMMRAERIVREADIRHEIDTYNQLLGADGELGCTLLIEIDDPAERDRKLSDWFELPENVYVRLSDGSRVPARFDESQRGRGRLSSVQYLKFPVDGDVPVALGVAMPGLQLETELSPEQRQALADDLA